MYNQFPDYLSCLNLSLEKTGSLKAFYDFESGAGDYIYNQLYTPDDHFVGNAINTDKLPGLSVGKTNWPVTGSGVFAGEDRVRIGRNIPYESWSATIDINPSLCSYRDESNVSRVLISTMESINSTSGFHVGINQSNRLYVQHNKDQQTYIKTLLHEINSNAVVEVAESENGIFLYHYDLDIGASHSVNVSADDAIHSDILFVGDFNSNTDIQYTGYQGYIHNLALFSGEFAGDNVNNHCKCMFGKGVNTVTTAVEDVSYEITGSTGIPIYTTGVTGFTDITSYLPQEDGSSLPIYYKSGMTGLIEVGEQTVFLTGNPFVSGYDVITSGVNYDEEKEKLYTRYFLNFRDGLVSGEKIEIHTFGDPRSDLQLKPDEDKKILSDKIRLYYYGAFNQASGDKTFSSPHEFDYYVQGAGGELFLSGYPVGQHNLIYDLVDTGSICIDFSGLWGGMVTVYNSDPEKHFRIDVDPSLGGVKYYPSTGQFIETGDDTVIITGVKGENGFVSIHDKDIYLNGQKLISGEGYVDIMHTEPAACSDTQYTTQATCEAAGTCSDTQYTTKATCEGADPVGVWTFETWTIEFNGPAVKLQPAACSDTQYITQATCEAAGTCSDAQYTTKTNCEGANPVGVWTPETWHVPYLPGWGYEGRAIQEIYDETEWSGYSMPLKVFNPELCFVPKTTGQNPDISVKTIEIPLNTSVGGISDPISGFSEMIWLNGLRQERGTDYRGGLECSLTKSFTFFEQNPLLFYNNSSKFLNIK
jgi:hypothetical protein